MDSFDYGNGLLGKVKNKTTIGKEVAANGGKSEETYEYLLELTDSDAEEVFEFSAKITFQKWYEIHDIRRQDPLWTERENFWKVLEKIPFTEDYTRVFNGKKPTPRSDKIKTRLSNFEQKGKSFSSGTIEYEDLFF